MQVQHLEDLQREAVCNDGSLFWGEGGEERHAGQTLFIALSLLHGGHHNDGSEGAALHTPDNPMTLSLQVIWVLLQRGIKGQPEPTDHGEGTVVTRTHRAKLL